MSDETRTMITEAGLRKLEDELHELKVYRRPEVAAKIKVAREQGDLSENADYDAAKEEQTEIETRINEIEAILKDVEVIAEVDFVSDKVNVGSVVKVLDCEYDEEFEYTIVGSSEADSRKGKISNESPLGKALMGHSVGETVEYSMPNAGTFEYKILNIKKMD